MPEPTAQVVPPSVVYTQLFAVTPETLILIPLSVPLPLPSKSYALTIPSVWLLPVSWKPNLIVVVKVAPVVAAVIALSVVKELILSLSSSACCAPSRISFFAVVLKLRLDPVPVKAFFSVLIVSPTPPVLLSIPESAANTLP